MPNCYYSEYIQKITKEFIVFFDKEIFHSSAGGLYDMYEMIVKNKLEDLKKVVNIVSL